MASRLVLLVAGFIAIAGLVAAHEPGEFPQPKNTQKETIPFLSPQESLKKLKLPEGFQATLFAAEPDVQQPIAMTFDSRGRLWVAENYTYAESKVNFDLTQSDRIVILEDTDHDGKHDKRTVFWDKGKRLTSIEVGFGGVWALCAPYLYFIPDRDGDDRPDGEPIVMLDGWNDSAVRHNIVNGLKWGPDGWLYGRHGIMAESNVGVPGTPADKRTKISCGIWRFHPVTKKFEVVCWGTTNSWGHDWDQHGELFFINTVIGHLWHAVPGAHFRRMYGADPNPHTYQLIEQTADHFHWDTVENWADIRSKGVTATTDQAGGGHAHSGMMIYQGDNWPEKYRNTLFTLNLHGRRINNDRLERKGAGYVGKHAPDHLRSDDPYFRGIELISGPDGGVYVADWSDIGECHDNDGVHRTSGRIYKVTYGKTQAPRIPDIAKLSDMELAELQLHPNDWYSRQSRRVLQERAAAGKDVADATKELSRIVNAEKDTVKRLRAMWGLHVAGGLNEAMLLRLLEDADEHIRVAAIRLLVDTAPPSKAAAEAFVNHAAKDASGLVLLHLASAAQSLPAEDRWKIIAPLSQHGDFRNDASLPLMMWFGMEGGVLANPPKAVEVAISSKLSLLRRFIARRLTSGLAKQSDAVGKLLEATAKAEDFRIHYDVLGGMTDAMRGWRKTSPPPGWEAAQTKFAASSNPSVRSMARELAVVFGDGRALDELKAVVVSEKEPLESRKRAIQVLAENRAPDLMSTLVKLLDDRDLAADAIRSLATLDRPEVAKTLVERLPTMKTGGRTEAIAVLSGRVEWAKLLFQSIDEKKVDREAVAVFQVRQMQNLKDDGVQKTLARLWPELRPISSQKQSLIGHYRKVMTEESLAKGDRTKGKAVWVKNCASCHTLFGEGGKIGPDLTGSQRTNLEYLLENIIDPSSSLAPEFRMSILVMNDGRTIQGIVVSKNEQTLVVQTPTERLTLRKADAESVTETRQSLMPEGLLDVLKREEQIDLFAYLMSQSRDR
ncbi:MAG: c-type cytochrome [Gemmataceae bacterium]|nr:c-type cytochrome [Gemmataceae bacterium]